MSTRGSQFTRTMHYFRDADIDEAKAALNAATEIVTERVDALNEAARATVPKVRKQRKPRQAPAAHEASAAAAGAASQSGGS